MINSATFGGTTWKLCGAGATLQNFGHCSSVSCVHQLVQPLLNEFISQSGLIIRLYRARTRDSLLEALVFLKCNIMQHCNVVNLICNWSTVLTFNNCVILDSTHFYVSCQWWVMLLNCACSLVRVLEKTGFHYFIFRPKPLHWDGLGLGLETWVFTSGLVNITAIKHSCRRWIARRYLSMKSWPKPHYIHIHWYTCFIFFIFLLFFIWPSMTLNVRSRSPIIRRITYYLA